MRGKGHLQQTLRESSRPRMLHTSASRKQPNKWTGKVLCSQSVNTFPHRHLNFPRETSSAHKSLTAQLLCGTCCRLYKRPKMLTPVNACGISKTEQNCFSPLSELTVLLQPLLAVAVFIDAHSWLSRTRPSDTRYIKCPHLGGCLGLECGQWEKGKVGTGWRCCRLQEGLSSPASSLLHCW